MYFLKESDPIPGDRRHTSQGVVGVWLKKKVVGVVRGVIDDDTGDIISLYIPPQTADNTTDDIHNTNAFANSLIMLADRTSGRRKARVFFRPRVDALRSLDPAKIAASTAFLFCMQERPICKHCPVHKCTCSMIPYGRTRHAFDFSRVCLNMSHQVGPYIAMATTVPLSNGRIVSTPQPVRLLGDYIGGCAPGTISRVVKLAIYDVLVTALSDVRPCPVPPALIQAAHYALADTSLLLNANSDADASFAEVLDSAIAPQYDGTRARMRAAAVESQHLTCASVTNNPTFVARANNVYHPLLEATIDVLDDVRVVPTHKSSHPTWPVSAQADTISHTCASRTANQWLAPAPAPAPLPPTVLPAALASAPASASVSGTSSSAEALILPGTRSANTLSANELKGLRRKLRNRESAARANLRRQLRTAELRASIAQHKQLEKSLRQRLESLRLQNMQLRSKLQAHTQ